MNASKRNSKPTWIDPDDAPELDEDFFEKATPKIGGKPVSKEEIKAAFKARRGAPVKENPKQPVSIRLSPEVAEYFRATGKGWQTRVDEVLREYVDSKR